MTSCADVPRVVFIDQIPVSGVPFGEVLLDPFVPFRVIEKSLEVNPEDLCLISKSILD